MPELPATTLKNYCYFDMFRDCSNLKETKILPATEDLPAYCYSGMFSYCTSLEATPEFSINSLDLSGTNQCECMFDECINLHILNCNLNATVLTKYCYDAMFEECSNLEATPALPAIVLTDSCYEYMFSGTAISKSPYLPAETLANRCYFQMFYECSLLTSVTVGFHQ